MIVLSAENSVFGPLLEKKMDKLEIPGSQDSDKTLITTPVSTQIVLLLHHTLQMSVCKLGLKKNLYQQKGSYLIPKWARGQMWVSKKKTLPENALSLRGMMLRDRVFCSQEFLVKDFPQSKPVTSLRGNNE